MTNERFLVDYRLARQELAHLENQLEQCGCTGCPPGARASRLGESFRGTNDPVSAAIQQQDGLEEMISEARTNMASMENRFEALVGAARNRREKCILLQYYHYLKTDAFVAGCLGVSERHVGRLKRDLLNYLNNMSEMSGHVLACPGET